MINFLYQTVWNTENCRECNYLVKYSQILKLYWWQRFLFRSLFRFPYARNSSQPSSRRFCEHPRFETSNNPHFRVARKRKRKRDPYGFFFNSRRSRMMGRGSHPLEHPTIPGVLSLPLAYWAEKNLIPQFVARRRLIVIFWAYSFLWNFTTFQGFLDFLKFISCSWKHKNALSSL